MVENYDINYENVSYQNNQRNEGRSLPRFGDWDVNDPTSGDGFTVIFNKARDERASKKHGSSQNLRQVQSRTNSKTPPKPQNVSFF